jgi:hypothetical protein
MLEEIAKDVAPTVLEKFDLVFYSFAVDTSCNSFHFIFSAWDDRRSFAQVINYLKTHIEKTFNRKMGRTGPLWDGKPVYEVLAA